MGKRDRPRKPARRKPFVDPKPLILIVCEGLVSEPQYFYGLSDACKNPLVRISVAGGKGVPRSVVIEARELKKKNAESATKGEDENIRYDSVWCVFDVDDHPNVANSVQMARDNGIKTAVSNPSFELWLLLHHQEPPGMLGRDQIRDLVRRHVPDYEKQVDFSLFAAGYKAAIKRSQRLEVSAKARSETCSNPSTGVHVLACEVWDPFATNSEE